MIDQETRDKVARLPAWARDLIKWLEGLPEQLADEAARLRRENSNLQDRLRRAQEANEAMTELFQAAGRGGSDYAAAVTKVLEGYEIFPAAEAVGS